MTARPEAVTDTGRVRGLWRDHASADGRVSRSAAFLGIPYAAAPVREARFAAPLPAAHWDGVREAVLHGATPQRVSPFVNPAIPEPSVPGSETLTVSVTTPDPSPGAHLPVLVWIHGGGFIGGSPASPWYAGQAMARDGVVTVSVSYRLGFEGFGWVDGGVNNRGVRDWLAALEWVQRNVSSFGGDPARVTIGGQSAGGAAVMRLLAMPAAQHLFGAVLAISPPDVPATVEQAREASVLMASHFGVSPSELGFSGVDERALFDARDLASAPPTAADPVAAIADALTGALPLSPIIDGDLIPQSIAGALAAGVGADKRVLIGATAHEFNGATAQFAPMLAGSDVADILERAGIPARVARAMAERADAEPDVGEVPGSASGARVARALGQAVTDLVFRRNVAGWAEIRERAGAEPTWAYDFRWESRAPGIEGSVHCIDLPFCFDVLARPDAHRLTGDAPQKLADAVHADWLGLISGALVDAPRFGGERSTIVYRDAPIREVEPGYKLEGELWDATSD